MDMRTLHWIGRTNGALSQIIQIGGKQHVAFQEGLHMVVKADLDDPRVKECITFDGDPDRAGKLLVLAGEDEITVESLKLTISHSSQEDLLVRINGAKDMNFLDTLKLAAADINNQGLVGAIDARKRQIVQNVKIQAELSAKSDEDAEVEPEVKPEAKPEESTEGDLV